MSFQVHVRQCVKCHRCLVRPDVREAWKPYHGTLADLQFRHQIIHHSIFECADCLVVTFRRIAQTAGAVH